jgi:hypothetical protein
MNDWEILVAVAFLLCIIVAYIIEVILGSRLGTYNAELGYSELGNDGDCGTRTLSNREFFYRYLPLMLGGAGLLFLLAWLG